MIRSCRTDAVSRSRKLDDFTLEQFEDRYSDLCDFFWRLFHEEDPDDGLCHTSSESRALARRVFEVLGIWSAPNAE
jgi:hypothetical protein